MTTENFVREYGHRREFVDDGRFVGRGDNGELRKGVWSPEKCMVVTPRANGDNGELRKGVWSPEERGEQFHAVDVVTTENFVREYGHPLLDMNVPHAGVL